MATEIDTYKRMFNERQREIAELLDGADSDMLTWRPFETSPWKGPSGSVGWLVAHGVSSAIYLLRQAEWAASKREWADVNGDEGSDEFGPANHDPAYLRARVVRAIELSHAMLDAMSDAELSAERPHPTRANRVVTARFAVQHAYEHLSQHIGHAQLTRQLWALNRAP